MKIISLSGIVALIGVAWLLSEHRRRFPWRAVLWGLTLQFFLGWFILKTGPGERLFNACQQVVSRFIGFANEGNRLLFGPLADETAMSKAFGPENALFFALVLTGIIVLISTVSSILYHYGLLQWVVRAAAWVMRRTMGTSGSETLGAAANIFMGQTEAPLVIKPYLARMTRSELHCLMVGGFATIAGSVMGVYSGLLKVPAGHLLTASVMSAPAALLISKILIPETADSETAAGSTAQIERETVNGIDAACSGAGDGMRLAINVIAMLLAFTSLVAAVNWLLGEGVGLLGWQTQRPLQTLLDRHLCPLRLRQLLLDRHPDGSDGRTGSQPAPGHRPARIAGPRCRQPGEPDERRAGRTVPAGLKRPWARRSPVKGVAVLPRCEKKFTECLALFPAG